MAHQLIQVLKSENVEFIVAPYEADAQLAYLSSLELEQGGIAAVITEDSDLLAYGCKAVRYCFLTQIKTKFMISVLRALYDMFPQLLYGKRLSLRWTAMVKERN
jgi:5'-3' exonuclease